MIRPAVLRARKILVCVCISRLVEIWLPLRMLPRRLAGRTILRRMQSTAVRRRLARESGRTGPAAVPMLRGSTRRDAGAYQQHRKHTPGEL